MKTALFILLAALCYVQCRKIVQVDQHANTAFINMEAGGPPKQPAKAAPLPAPAQPAKVEPTKPGVNSAPAYSPFPASASTPGPGSVKSLFNFFDSQAKHSVICPYSFADAVKQGGKSCKQLSFTDNGLTAVYNIDCRFSHINLYFPNTKPAVDV